MIGYLDTSAFVPIMVREPGSDRCREFWNDADAVASSRLLYVEATAAFAQARRVRRISTRTLTAACAILDRFWPELDVVEIDRILIARAADLARRFDLHGYDAVHCAAAEQIEDDDLVAASGDRQLLEAWQRLGIATLDTNAA